MDKDILDIDPFPANNFPFHVYFNCPEGISVTIENEEQWKLYNSYPWEQQRMHREAIFQHFFPKITESEMREICVRLSIYSHDSAETVYEKVKDYYFKVRDEKQAKAEQAARDQKLLETMKKVTRRPAKGRTHEYGAVKKAYEHFQSMRPEDCPKWRTFQNWVAGRAPKGFPEIKTGDELEYLNWIRDWDGPERRRAGKPITGMSAEEIHRKRKD